MKVVIAIDSFKGSLGSVEAGRAAAEGIRRAIPDAVCRVCPLADGGEGTVAALVEGFGGEMKSVRVTGPAGHPVVANYGLLPNGVAVLEMAEAAGITLVSGAEKNPLYTTTYGVGEMILDAVRQGAREFIVGIGGSATNDGGAGMLQALGWRLLDAEGRDLPRGGAALARLAKIVPPAAARSSSAPYQADASAGGTADDSALAVGADHRAARSSSAPYQADAPAGGAAGDSALAVGADHRAARFRIACDVTNPLCGDKGASAVFGPQKGATPDMVRELDAALAHYAAIAEQSNTSVDRFSRPAFATFPGSGAAGGLGFAFKAFLGAELVPGVELILKATGLEESVRDADVVVTGEGRLDGQTVMGKAPIGVARLAKKYGKRVIAFCGCVGDGVESVNGAGIDAYFPILRTVTTLEAALDRPAAAANLSAAAEQAFRLLNPEVISRPHGVNRLLAEADHRAVRRHGARGAQWSPPTDETRGF